MDGVHGLAGQLDVPGIQGVCLRWGGGDSDVRNPHAEGEGEPNIRPRAPINPMDACRTPCPVRVGSPTASLLFEIASMFTRRPTGSSSDHSEWTPMAVCRWSCHDQRSGVA